MSNRTVGDASRVVGVSQSGSELATAHNIEPAQFPIPDAPMPAIVCPLFTLSPTFT